MSNKITRSPKARFYFKLASYLGFTVCGLIVILFAANAGAGSGSAGTGSPISFWSPTFFLTLGTALFAVGATGAISTFTDKGIDGELFEYLSILDDERLTSSESEDLSYFRRHWHVYHLTNYDNGGGLNWVYTFLDLSKRRPGQLVGATRHKPTDAPYQINGFLRRDKLFLVHTSASDRLMSPSISSFPNCRNFGELHAGWLQHVCYSNLQRLSPIIISKNPLVDMEPGNFSRADSSIAQKLFAVWRNNQEIQETVKSLNQIMPLIVSDAISMDSFAIHLPKTSPYPLEQDEEEFTLDYDDKIETVRIHDYDIIFSLPNLYEQLIHEKLGCVSQAVVSALFSKKVAERGYALEGITVVDVGAGNGVVSDALREHGFRKFIGIDRSQVAAVAARRDRPNLYETYLVADLSDSDSPAIERIKKFGPSALVAVSCLGFGDAGPLVLLNSLRVLGDAGLACLTLRDKFYDHLDSEFRILLDELKSEGFIKIDDPVRFKHRKSVDGRPIYYYAIFCELLKEITRADVDQLEAKLNQSEPQR